MKMRIKLKVIKTTDSVTLFANKDNETRSLTLSLIDNKNNTYSSVINVINGNSIGTRDGNILFYTAHEKDLSNYCETVQPLQFSLYTDPMNNLKTDSLFAELIAERLFETIVDIEDF